MTVASFVLVGLTGLPLLLGYHKGLVNIIHQYSGALFVLSSLLHVWIHWRTTLAHLRRPLGAGLAGSCLVLALVALLPFGTPGNPGRSALFKSAGVMLNLSIDEVAGLTRQPKNRVEDNLKQAGFPIQVEGASLRAIAQANHKQGLEAVAASLASVPAQH